MVKELFGYFSVAIIVIVIAVFYTTARREAQKEVSKSDRMNFIVRAPRFYRVGGIICASFFGSILIVLSFAAADSPDHSLYTSIFAGLFVLGACIAYYTFRFKLVVSGNWIELTPFIGNGRKYCVRDITHIKVDSAYGVRVYAGKKRLFLVDVVSVGCGMFISYLIEKGVRVPEKINFSRFY